MAVFGRWFIVSLALWLNASGCERAPSGESVAAPAPSASVAEASPRKRLLGTWRIEHGELKSGQSRVATKSYQAEINAKTIVSSIGDKPLKRVDYEVVEEKDSSIVIRLSSGATERYTFTGNDKLEVEAGDAGARVVFVRVR